jgi:hypothetical protein
VRKVKAEKREIEKERKKERKREISVLIVATT